MCWLQLSIAVNDADDNDDGHTKDGAATEQQPAVWKLPGDDVLQEDGSRVSGVTHRAVASP